MAGLAPVGGSEMYNVSTARALRFTARSVPAHAADRRSGKKSCRNVTAMSRGCGNEASALYRISQSFTRRSATWTSVYAFRTFAL